MRWTWENGQREELAAAMREVDRLKAESILAGEEPLRCPECRSDRALGIIGQLYEVVIRDGQVKALKGGYRLACQVESCGATFSVDRHGIFRQGVNALPLTPQLQRMVARDGVPEKEPRMPPPPVWRQTKDMPTV